MSVRESGAQASSPAVPETASAPAERAGPEGPVGVIGLQSEETLLARYARQPTPALEEELVRRFLPLARSLALRYRGGVERTEDLVQVASLALVKALRERRVLERLRDRHMEQARAVIAHAEGLVMDDVAVTRHARRAAGEAGEV